MYYLICFVILILSASPLALGWAVGSGMISTQGGQTMMTLALGLLIFWLLLSAAAKFYFRSTGGVLLLMHLVPLLALIMTAVRQLGYAYRWPNFLTESVRLFYMPLEVICRRIPLGGSSAFRNALVGFVLLLVSSLIGCLVIRGRRKPTQNENRTDL